MNKFTVKSSTKGSPNDQQEDLKVKPDVAEVRLLIFYIEMFLGYQNYNTGEESDRLLDDS